MMTQGEASTSQTYQVNDPKVMLTSMGHDQHIMQEQQHQVVQGPSGANIQYQNPLVMHATYQQQTQQPQNLVTRHQVDPNVSNMQ